jgi:hypothetical protein
VILVLRPDVAHGNHCPDALDRPTRVPRGFLEFKALGQGDVEGLRTSACVLVATTELEPSTDTRFIFSAVPQTKRLTNASARSATSRQPLSMVSE